MLSRVQRTIREHALLPPGERVLVGLSGGPDSTVLLDVLLRLRPALGLGEIRALVVDHGLRQGSSEEAGAVSARAREAGTSCRVVRVEVRGARLPHVSLQQAARTVRLAALEAAAREDGCRWVALGHTADDQAETVIFRILRGTGVSGLAGIPYARGIFVRPLLDVRRKEIARYVNRRALSVVSDPSNADTRFARARIRQEVLPLLARENPRIVDALLALSADARRVPSLTSAALADGAPHLPARTRAVVERLTRAASGTRTVAVAGGEIAVTYGEARFRPSRPSAPLPVGPLIVTGPGPYAVSPEGPAIRIEDTDDPSGHPVAFAAEALAWPLVVRPIARGDRMRPRRGQGSRKVSDLLIDAKIPRERRPTLPALVDAAGTVLFVPGLRPSAIGAPDATSRRFVVVTVTGFAPAQR